MPQLTPRLGLQKPLGNEIVSRIAYSFNLDVLDERVASLDDLLLYEQARYRPNSVRFPFTTGTTFNDLTGTIAWTVYGSPAQPGLAGLTLDGVDDRLCCTAIPAWLQTAAAQFGLQITYKSAEEVPADVEDFVARLSTASPCKDRLLLKHAVDPGKATYGRYVLDLWDGSSWQPLLLQRTHWALGGQAPNPAEMYLQGITFAGDCLVLACYSPTGGYSQVYEYDPATWRLRRSFRLDSPYEHVAGLASDDVEGFWITDYASGRAAKIDYEASMASGAAVILKWFDLNMKDGAKGPSGATFVSYQGVTRLAVSQYGGGAAAWTHIIDHNAIENGGTYSEAEHKIKKWSNRGRSQGLGWDDSYLWESDNDGAAAPYAGSIDKLDIVAITDGGAYTEGLIATVAAPSGYPEDLAFDAAGNMWCGTEGDQTTPDSRWMAVWRRPATGYAENTLRVNFDGVGMDVYLNDHLWLRHVHVPGLDATRLVIGGHAEPAGGLDRFWGGVVKNLVIQDRLIDDTLGGRIARGDLR